MNCYECKFALQARKHPRKGEQVQCKRAEELFGGERWVDVRKGKKGQLLKAKCGEFKSFIGDTSEAPDTKKTKPAKRKQPCQKCGGTGKIKITVFANEELMRCSTCGGAGSVTNGTN